MKTKEFIRRVEELGYRFREYDNSIAIIASIYGYAIAIIDKKEMYSFSIGSDLGIDNPERYITDKLLELIVEYGKTPIEDRAEESFLTTKEFIEKVNNLGFNVEIIKDGNPSSPMYGKDSILKIWLEEELVAKIWLASTYAINTFNGGHTIYRRGYDLNALYRLCFEYVGTPVDER